MDYINKRICHLAKSLLVNGEFLSWRRFSRSPISIADIKISPVCNKQTDRIVVGARGSSRDNEPLFIALDNHGYGSQLSDRPERGENLGWKLRC